MTVRNFTLTMAIAIILAPTASTQALSVDPPAQIGAEIKRVEAAWNRWRSSANPKLEQTILTNSRAIADVARDEQGAMQYLDARRQLFEKMASAFASQIEALRSAEPAWNTATVEQAEHLKLAEVLATEERLLAVPKGLEGDSARELLFREQQERDLNTVADLKRTIHHRLDTLEAMAGDERAAHKQLEALTANLEQVRRHFQDLANSTDAEKAEWQDYFNGLRQIVVRSGVPQQGKTPKVGNADPASVTKPRRER